MLYIREAHCNDQNAECHINTSAFMQPPYAGRVQILIFSTSLSAFNFGTNGLKILKWLINIYTSSNMHY